MKQIVGVLLEEHEGRVALTPDGVGRLAKLGLDTVVQAGAGVRAWFPDAAYAKAGATIVDAQEVLSRADIVVCLHAPERARRAQLRPGQILIGLFAPLTELALAQELAEAKVTALSLDGLPRTLSSAQSMDALTSQANVAGYKAALVAADTYGSYLPMLMTAAGTVRPATVLVVGAGVAGLAAIGTARRLGAIVTGYDVREAAQADIRSTGATSLDLDSAVTAAATGVTAQGDGGYARELTADEHQAQQAAMVAAVARFDIVITTAQVPGRKPPLLISAEAVAGMHAGAVVVDLAASELGGNVAGSMPESTVVSDNGVTLIGAGQLASAMPTAASTAYSRNVAALLAHLVHDGELTLDPKDGIVAGILLTRDGDIVNPAVLAATAATPSHQRTFST